ncbi:MAG: hypothetical protein ACK5QH_08930 [Rubrivivax sp.]|jgi:hypothetical protein
MTVDLHPDTLERIAREARAAAHQYRDINDACPYPFGTRLAEAFKREFDAQKEAIAQMKERGR